MEHPLARYLRPGTIPSTFCPGCGCGMVLNALLRAVDRMRLDPDDMVMVTGIGCSSWIPSPMFSCDTLHTTHGRAVAFATGVKLMMPQKRVLIVAGDGDLAGIGGNHLVHAAHRNMDLGVMMVNNRIYGMTGGQCSPTTPAEMFSTTTPYGNLDQPMTVSELMAAAGANYVARWTTYHVRQLSRSMEELMAGEGFRFLEIVSQCPTHFGKDAKRAPAEVLDQFKERSIPFKEATEAYDGSAGARLPVGVLVDRGRHGYLSRLEGAEKGIRKMGEQDRPGAGGPGLRPKEGLSGSEAGARPPANEKRMTGQNVCFSGLGGQGIVLLGVVLGEAGAHAGLNALQTQSYGAEARGGASYSAVMLSRERILDIAPEDYDALVALSQPAYDKFSRALKLGGTLIYDTDLVRPAEGAGKGIPATALAKEHLGKELYANMVAFGYFARVSGIVDRMTASAAIEASVPKGTSERNLKAFEIGYEYTG